MKWEIQKVPIRSLREVFYLPGEDFPITIVRGIEPAMLTFRYGRHFLVELSQNLLRRARMKRVSIFLGMVFVFLMFGSYVLADCPDSTYYCHKNHGNGPSVGTVTFGNCWTWSAFACRICGGDYSRPTQECNRRYATQCEGNCWACPHYADFKEKISHCYDANGNCQGSGCDSGW